jgi:hypothetical protein
MLTKVQQWNFILSQYNNTLHFTLPISVKAIQILSSHLCLGYDGFLLYFKQLAYLLKNFSLVGCHMHASRNVHMCLQLRQVKIQVYIYNMICMLQSQQTTQTSAQWWKKCCVSCQFWAYKNMSYCPLWIWTLFQ